MSVLEQLRAIAVPPAPRGRGTREPPGPVDVSDDLDRILALPRREPPDEKVQEELAKAMTVKLRRERPVGSCACAALRPEVVARGQNPCITELRPIQGWYLHEAASNPGVLGPIAVGGGKTGIDVLLPMVVQGCALAVLLIPPGLRSQLMHDYKVWSQHFNVPNLVGGPGPFHPGRPRLEVFPYSQLQLEKNALWLKTRKPDVVIADEVHAFRDRKSVRTSRFLRYFAENPGTRFYCHSGSMTTKSVQDYAHLSALSLRDGSPLPLDPNTAEEWSMALDPLKGGFSAGAGALRRLCENGENVRNGFHRRLVQTSGVVATADARLPTRLLLGFRNPPPMPDRVLRALQEVRDSGERPDGEALIDDLQIAACARQVAAGFYLYWAYPRGEPLELIDEWFDRRKAWGKELRDRLMRRTDGLDSPKLLRDAAERFARGEESDRPAWDSATWGPWKEIADKVQPITRVQWIDDWLMRDAAQWGHEAPGIIWYDNEAVGRRIAELGGHVQYGPGDEAADGIQRERGDRTVVASLGAHWQGRNLQSFWRNLFVQPAFDYEQTVGRTHRPGQPMEAVSAEFYMHSLEYSQSLEWAKEKERYVRDTTGGARKLLYGEWDFSTKGDTW